MRKFIIKSIIYLIVCVSTVNVIGYLCFYFLRQSNLYKPSFLLNSFTPCDTIDYIVLGSSTGLCTVNTIVIDSICHTKGLNLSIDDAGSGAHLLMLKHFIYNGYKTKYCIWTIDPGRVNSTPTDFSNNELRFLPYVANDYVYQHIRERELVNQIYPFRSLSKYCPMFGLSYFNVQLFPSALQAALYPKHAHRSDSRGNYLYPNSDKIPSEDTPCIFDTLTFKNSDVVEMEQHCKQNNIELIYYCNPVYHAQTVSNTQRNVINHRDSIASSLLFYDRSHTNAIGTKIASKMLGRELLSIW